MIKVKNGKCYVCGQEGIRNLYKIKNDNYNNSYCYHCAKSLEMRQCDNCGKFYTKYKKVNIGEEQFYICENCIDVIEKFKQRHKI